MGCGFSAGDKLASEEDRILDSTPENNSVVNNNTTTGMGGGHSKTKASKRKSNNGTISGTICPDKFMEISNQMELTGKVSNFERNFYIIGNYNIFFCSKFETSPVSSI